MNQSGEMSKKFPALVWFVCWVRSICLVLSSSRLGCDYLSIASNNKMLGWTWILASKFFKVRFNVSSSSLQIMDRMKLIKEEILCGLRPCESTWQSWIDIDSFHDSYSYSASLLWYVYCSPHVESIIPRSWLLLEASVIILAWDHPFNSSDCWIFGKW